MLLLVATVVCLLSATVTRFIRDYSRRRRLLDVPGNRSSHSVPTPRLGGVAIAGVCLAAWGAAAWWQGEGTSFRVVLIVSAALATAVGLVDDLVGLSPPVKLAGQLLAVLPVFLGPREAVPGEGGVPAILIRVLEALWIVGYTNIFNFMDGSDGLAGGTAGLTAVFLALIAWQSGTPAMTWPLLLLAAALGGFLRYNWPPASIFMGDSGSLFLGTALSVMGVGLYRAGARPEALALVFTPFVFDGLFTLARRASRREPLWLAHRSHLYQRLLVAGKSHAWVARLYLAWGLASGAAALACSVAPGRSVLPAGAFVAFTGGLLILLVWRTERTDGRRGGVRGAGAMNETGSRDRGRLDEFRGRRAR